MTASNLYDLYEDNCDIQKKQEALNIRKKEQEEKKNSLIKSYFLKHGIENLKELPISAKSFISCPKFSLKKSDKDNVFWVATGNRITVRDGKKIYGSSIDELWQGQFEALPTTVQTLTIEEACNKAKSLFEMTGSIFKGCDFSAPGYVLHTSSENQWQLVWRKAGNAYIDRATKSLASSSGLQLLYLGKSENLYKTWSDFSAKLEKVIKNIPIICTDHFNLTEGGRLSVSLIEKEKNKIDAIFGEGIANTIIEKLKLENTERTQVRKELKNKP